MDVFVYGTLTDPARVDAILEEWSFGPDAILEGLQRVEGRYPTLAPGGSVAGRVLRTPAIEELDRYEGVESGLYIRVPVSVEAGDGVESALGETADVYVGDPELLGVDDDVEWPDTASTPFDERVRTYIREHDVVVAVRDG